METISPGKTLLSPIMQLLPNVENLAFEQHGSDANSQTSLTEDRAAFLTLGLIPPVAKGLSMHKGTC